MNEIDIEQQFAGLLDHSVESDEYWSAVGKIRTAGVAFGWEYVLRQCKSDNPEIRLRAVDVLAQIEGRDETITVSILMDLLETERNQQVIRSCLFALGHQYEHKNSFFAAVERFSDNADVEIRLALTHALPKSKFEDGAVPKLIGLMSDESSEVRDWATFGLGAMMEVDSPAVRDALAKRLDDIDFDTQLEAIYGLAHRKDMRAIVPLVRHIDSGWWSDVAEDSVVELLEIDMLPDEWDLDQISKELRRLPITIPS